MIDVKIIENVGFYNDQITKIDESRLIIEKVVNSDKFKESVLNFKSPYGNGFYFRKTLWGKYVDSPQLNEDVFKIITRAREHPGNVSDGHIDLYLHLDERKGGGTVGYGFKGKKEIYTYSDWFKSFNSLGYACHIAHEWCHKLGFTHAERKNDRRQYSVPYAIGYLIEDIYEQL